MTPQLLTSRSIKLDANGDAELSIGGNVFVFDSSLSTVSIDITWLIDHQEAGAVKGVLLGRLLNAGAPFSGVRISGGDPDDTIQVLVGPSDAYARESAAQVVIGHVIVDNEVEVKNDAGNPLAVTGNVKAAGHTNAKVTAGAASADALAANAARKYLSIQNPSDTEYVYFRTDGGVAVADATAHKLYPGQSYEPAVPPTGKITCIRGGVVDVDFTVTEA